MNYVSYITALFFSITALTFHGSEKQETLPIIKCFAQNHESLGNLDEINQTCDAILIPHFNNSMLISLSNFTKRNGDQFETIQQDPISYSLAPKDTEKILLRGMATCKDDVLIMHAMIENNMTEITVENRITKTVTIDECNTTPAIQPCRINLINTSKYSDVSSYNLLYKTEEPSYVSFRNDAHKVLLSCLKECESKAFHNSSLYMNIAFSIMHDDQSIGLYRLPCRIGKINDTILHNFNSIITTWLLLGFFDEETQKLLGTTPTQQKPKYVNPAKQQITEFFTWMLS